MSPRILLCALLVVASSTSAMAANDGLPNAAPVSPPVGQPQGGQPQGGPPRVGTDVQPGAPACRQARPRPQLTAEEKARRKALRAQRAAQGMTQAAKPHAARLPPC